MTADRIGRYLVAVPSTDFEPMVLDLSDGTRVHVRPIAPEDEPLLHEAVAAMSERTVYFRFFSPLKRLPDALRIGLRWSTTTIDSRSSPRPTNPAARSASSAWRATTVWPAPMWRRSPWRWWTNISIAGSAARCSPFWPESLARTASRPSR